MDKSEQINELATALAKAQGEIRAAQKETNNPFFKTKYADLASVWEVCKGPLSKNGLAVAQTPVDCAEPGRVALETMLLHSSGQWISGVFSTKIAKDDAQGVGSAITYLRRYGLSAMVGVVADDDDGNAASSPSPRPVQQVTHSAPANASEIVEKIGRATRAELEGMGDVIKSSPIFISAAKSRLKQLGEM